MLITEKLNITSEDFFNVLQKSLQFDLSDDKIEIKNGLSYEKTVPNTLGKYAKVNITILEYIPLKKYVSQIERNGDANIISYEIVDVQDDGIIVNYQEEFISKSKLSVLNYKLVAKVLKKQSKLKMQAMLKRIEANALDLRKVD